MNLTNMFPLLLFILFCTIAIPRDTIAVANFEGVGISTDEAIILSNRLRVELVRQCEDASDCIVIERSSMEEILKEQKFQYSGCVSNACIVRIGQLLGARSIIGGSIGKVGNVYTINAREINVETGEIRNVATFDHDGAIEFLLSEGMLRIAMELLGLEVKSSFGIDKYQSKDLSEVLLYYKLGLINEYLTDYDGNSYNIIKVGEQVWIGENLRVSHYRNGDPIPIVYTNSDWINLTTGACGLYNNDPANSETYGNLYNWYAIEDDRGVCPEHWHVPSDEDYMELEMSLGMSQQDTRGEGWRGTNEGGILKSSGRPTDEGNDALWLEPSLGATNKDGFKALPSGYRDNDDGYYYNMGTYGYFWTSTEVSNNLAWYRMLKNSSSEVNRNKFSKQCGFSIRCVGDEGQ